MASKARKGEGNVRVRPVSYLRMLRKLGDDERIMKQEDKNSDESTGLILQDMLDFYPSSDDQSEQF